MAKPKYFEDLKTVIGTKCFNCKVPLGYVVTPASEEHFKEIVAGVGLYYYCEHCLQEHFGITGT